jgi:hypothetical protein
VGTETVEVRYLKPIALFGHAADPCLIAKKVSRLSSNELATLKFCPEDHVSTPCKTLKLRTIVPQKIAFHRGDARRMMDAAMQDPTSTRVALQYYTIIRCLNQSGVPPSNAFVTKYHSKYMRVGNIKLSRRKSGRPTDGLCLKCIITNNKGHH